MEYWSRRGKWAVRALWSMAVLCIGGSLAAIIWLVVFIILDQDSGYRAYYLVILCLPIPYIVFMFLAWKRGFSPLGRWRIKRRLADLPAGAHPKKKTMEVWDWLPLRGRLHYGGLTSSLSPMKDIGWSKLAEANERVRVATGQAFDILVLLKKGPCNFVSGELPGAGAWIAAPRRLVDELGREELMAPLIHELFHRETGELKARRIALALSDFGAFATAFVLYYLFMALALASVPLDKEVSGLPCLAVLILVLWMLIKIVSRWSMSLLLPLASCMAADEYAGHVFSDPGIVAGSLLRCLRYSVSRMSSKSLAPAGGVSSVAALMFAPLITDKQGVRGQVKRVEALSVEPAAGDGEVLPQVTEMNRRIESIAGEVDREYEKLRSGGMGRVGVIVAYVFIVLMILGILAMSTRKNFLPVRLCIDFFSGGANTVAAEPTESGTAVCIMEDAPSYGDASRLSPESVMVTVGETVTWANQGQEECLIEGEAVPEAQVIGPGGSCSVEVNRSGHYSYRVLNGTRTEVIGTGSISAFY